MAKIELLTSVDHLRADLLRMENDQLIAQEICQKGAMHAIRFLIHELEAGADMPDILRQMRASLQANAMAISEECARRGLPVIQENG